MNIVEIINIMKSKMKSVPKYNQLGTPVILWRCLIPQTDSLAGCTTYIERAKHIKYIRARLLDDAISEYFFSTSSGCFWLHKSMWYSSLISALIKVLNARLIEIGILKLAVPEYKTLMYIFSDLITCIVAAVIRLLR